VGFPRFYIDWPVIYKIYRLLRESLKITRTVPLNGTVMIFLMADHRKLRLQYLLRRSQPKVVFRDIHFVSLFDWNVSLRFMYGGWFTNIFISPILLRSQVSIRGCPWGLSILAGNLQDGCTNTEIQGIIIFTQINTLYLVKIQTFYVDQIYSYLVCHTLIYFE